MTTTHEVLMNLSALEKDTIETQLAGVSSMSMLAERFVDMLVIEHGAAFQLTDTFTEREVRAVWVNEFRKRYNN